MRDKPFKAKGLMTSAVIGSGPPAQGSFLICFSFMVSTSILRPRGTQKMVARGQQQKAISRLNKGTKAVSPETINATDSTLMLNAISPGW